MSQPVRFIHSTKNPRLRYTAAYTFTKGSDNTLNITYGISQCSKGDNFTRETGRFLSNLRLAELPNHVNRKSIYYGSFSIPDAEGLGVGREVQKHFESARKNKLNKTV